MNNNSNIITLIKKKQIGNNINKLSQIAKQKYLNITCTYLKYLIDNSISHGIKSPLKHDTTFNNKIVSTHRHSYQMNIFVNIT
jgi:hypothetical protein